MNEPVKYNIKKFLIFFFLTILFQQLYPYISVMGIAPNIAFILVMCSAMLEKDAPNSVYAFIFGALYDYLNGKVFGIYILVFVLISFGIFELYHSYFENMAMVEILCLFLGFFVYGMLFAVFFALSEENFAEVFIKITLVEFIYNSLLGIIVYFIYRKILTTPIKRKNTAWRV